MFRKVDLGYISPVCAAVQRGECLLQPLPNGAITAVHCTSTYSIQTPALALTTTASHTENYNIRKTVDSMHLWKYSHVSGPKVGRGLWETVSIFSQILLIFGRYFFSCFFAHKLNQTVVLHV